MMCIQCGCTITKIAGQSLDGDACLTCVIEWNCVQTAWAISREENPSKDNVQWAISVMKHIVDELIKKYNLGHTNGESKGLRFLMDYQEYEHSELERINKLLENDNEAERSD